MAGPPRRTLLLAGVLAATLAGAACAPGSKPAAQGPGSPAGAHWVPRPGTLWQWQLTGAIDQSVDVAVYDIDLFTNDASVVASLHYRPDSWALPESLKGSPVEGFRDERWLDIRRQDLPIPLMAARFDLCSPRDSTPSSPTSSRVTPTRRDSP